MTESLVDQLSEHAFHLAEQETDLRPGALKLLDLAHGDIEALREARVHAARWLHEHPESRTALGGLVLLGTALRLAN